MTGQPGYFQTTYYSSLYTCEKLKTTVEDQLAFDSQIQDYKAKCFKVPEILEKKDIEI